MKDSTVLPKVMGTVSVVCSMAAIAATLLVSSVPGLLLASAGLAMAFGGSMLGWKQGHFPAVVLLGLALGTAGLIMGVVL